METLTIRALTPADAPAWHRLMLQATRDHPADFGTSHAEHAQRSTADVAASIGAIVRDGGCVLGVFDAAGMLLGSAGLRRETAEHLRHKGLVQAVYVARPLHGRGIGRRLLAALIAFAREADGLEQLNLIVEAGNDAAKRLYAGLGFEPFGVEAREMKVAGRYHDGIHMALRLA